MSENTTNTHSWVLFRPQVTRDTHLTAGEGESHTGHTLECGRGRKPHEVHTLVRERAICLAMKDFSLILNGFSTDYAVSVNSTTSQDIRWLVTRIVDPPFVDRVYVCSVAKWCSRPGEGNMIKNSFLGQRVQMYKNRLMITVAESALFTVHPRHLLEQSISLPSFMQSCNSKHLLHK